MYVWAMSRLRALLLALLACGTVLVAGAAPASALSSLKDPPPGANDFSCQPSAAHPRPVVLLHGLGATMSENWSYLSPILKREGYCVFALTYGLDPRLPSRGGTISVTRSAPEVGAFVDRVLQATGATQVDFVGHSEGTFTPEYWLKVLGGGPKVHTYVAWTPLYDGTKLLGVSQLRDLLAPTGLSKLGVDLFNTFCEFCTEVLAGSDVVRQLNVGGSGTPGVRYTTIMTRYDELVVPYTSGINDRPDATNIVLQDVCRKNLSEHLLVAVDPAVARLTLNALDPANARPVRCDQPLGAQPAAAKAAKKRATVKKRAAMKRRG